MNYIIERNEQYNSLEITFPGKPSQAVRTALKMLKFHWNGKKGVWYGYSDEEKLKGILNNLEEHENSSEIQPEKREKKPQKVDKNMLREEYAKIFGDDSRWIEWHIDQVATVAYLPNGDVLPIEKQGINKRFCFGESGYDFEEAAQQAQYARTSEVYFKRENMKKYQQIIDRLKAKENTSDYSFTYLAFAPLKCYSSEETAKRESRIMTTRWYELTDIVKSCGGSCYTWDLPGKELTIRGEKVRIATKEEKEAVLEAYEEAAKTHEKKVDAYLKRYGTSKVHAWTYWRDA